MNKPKKMQYNINFLEYPLFFPENRQKKGGLFLYKYKNYTLFAANKPSMTDYLILCFLLYKAINNNFSYNVITSYYEIIKFCGFKDSGYTYKKIKHSLDNWISVSVKFDGSFYEKGSGYTSFHTNILSRWETKPDSTQLDKVIFTDKFIDIIKNSDFYKKIDIETYKQFNTTIGLRLYQILEKSFYKQNSFSIGIHNLAKKIPIQQKYASNIIQKVNSAINEINKNTNLTIEYSYNETDRNQGNITFKRIRKSLYDMMKEIQSKETKTKGKGISYDEFIKDMPDNELNTLKQEFIETEINKSNILKRKYNQNGFDDYTIQVSFMTYIKERKEN